MSAYPHDGAPIEAARGADRVFWMAVRQALTILMAAIEARHLPDLKRRRPQDEGPSNPLGHHRLR